MRRRRTCPWTRRLLRRCTAVICRRRSSHSSGTIRMRRFRTEFRRSKCRLTSRMFRWRRRCISRTLLRGRFRHMRRWRARATHRETGMCWCTSKLGNGSNPALYEMWQGIYLDGPWTDSSNADWPNVATDALTPQGQGTSDAAGLPVGPLLANADEVIGTGTPTAPNGTVQHPIRFTLNHMLNYWVWPATETAGVGSCDDSAGAPISTESEISQATPPASCTMSGAAGEIYRLKASVATPTCAATSPQAAIIITGLPELRNHSGRQRRQRRADRDTGRALERCGLIVPDQPDSLGL